MLFVLLLAWHINWKLGVSTFLSFNSVIAIGLCFYLIDLLLEEKQVVLMGVVLDRCIYEYS